MNKLSKNQQMTHFVWVTQDGEKLRVQQMTTRHLFFSLRMIWNHNAPIEHQLPGGRYHIDWPEQYIRDSILNLTKELARRDIAELDFDMRIQAQYIFDTIEDRAFLTKLLGY